MRLMTRDSVVEERVKMIEREKEMAEKEITS